MDSISSLLDLSVYEPLLWFDRRRRSVHEGCPCALKFGGTRIVRTPWLLLPIVMTFIAPPGLASSEKSLPIEVILEGFSHVLFEDEFNEIRIDNTDARPHAWYNGLWYETPNPLSQIGVEDGILTLETPPGRRSTSITTVARSGTAGVVFRHGFFEARMRFGNSENDWAAFWLFSRPHSLGTDGDHWCEIDIFEHFGANAFVGTVHDWTKQNHLTNSGAYHRLLGSHVDFSEWHRYGLLWTSQKLIWFLDGERIIETTPPVICESQDMFLIFGSQKHKDGPLERLQVDWVRVLSR